MTPPRDGAPPEDNELVARIIPLRRFEVGVDAPVQEPQVDVFDGPDDPESGLNPIEVFVAPREDLGIPGARSISPTASSSPDADGTLLAAQTPARPRRQGRRLSVGRWRAATVAVALVLVALAVVLAVSVPHHARPAVAAHHAPTVAAHHTATTTTTAAMLAASRAKQRAAAAEAARKRSDRAAAARAAQARARVRRKAAAHTSPPAQSVTTAGTPAASPAPSSAVTNPCASAVPGQLGC